MIPIYELRIGSYVNVTEFDKTFLEIESIVAYEEYVRVVNRTGRRYEVRLDALEPISLTPEIMHDFGFEGDIWFRKSLGLDIVGGEGEGGCFNLVLGMTSSVDGLPYHPALEQSNQGFSIQEAAKIQQDQNDYNDESYILKMKSSVVLYPIKYVHELQNLWLLSGSMLRMDTRQVKEDVL
jgi:hypothetical protein